MLRDAAGWEERRKLAEAQLQVEDLDEIDRIRLERYVETCKQGAKNALSELVYYGWKPAAPAKRAETRPADAGEKRGPGRPRKVQS